MNKFLKGLIAIGIMLGLTACGSVETENVGVRISWDSQVQMQEEGEGFYTAIFSSVEEWTGKEVGISLENMQPKAGDNLTMEDLDVEVFYKVRKDQIAEQRVKYSNRHVYDEGIWYPSYHLVKSFAREAVYQAVAKKDSLEIHKDRDAIKDDVKTALQALLDQDDPGVFVISKVVVKNARTDSTLEESIQTAIKKDKEFEAKQKEVAIATQSALANVELTKSLTPQIMRIKELEAMVSACSKGNTCIIDFTDGKGATPLIQIPRG